MIPNVVHFVYPVWKSTRPLSLLNYMAVRTVIEKHKPDDIKFWIDAEPVDNEWWHRIKQLVSVHHRKMSGEFMGVNVPFPQYQSDITRLQILQEEGGIYMDTDVLTLRSLDRFMSGPFTIGEEPSESSLCNAIMFSEANDPFLFAWLYKMPEALRSQQWANTGVVLPYELARTNKFTLNIVESELLCPFDLHYPYIFEPRLNRATTALLREAYTIHIYETYWRDLLKDVTMEWTKQHDCFFSKLVREME